MELLGQSPFGLRNGRFAALGMSLRQNKAAELRGVIPMRRTSPSGATHRGKSQQNRSTSIPRMAHNSGERPERIKIAGLSARDNAARDGQAVAIVDKWIAELAAGKRPQFSPTLEAAFRAKAHALDGETAQFCC
jgi:hypothetical protein